MPKAKETVLEIDLRAIEHNYKFLRTKTRPETKFLGVIKAFAYGSDSVRIAKKLEALGIDYFAVAYVDEGVRLRKAGIKVPILVLHPLPVGFDKLIKYRLEPSLYSREVLKAFRSAAKKQGQIYYPVHLKFNTGLNRLGFGADDIDFIVHESKIHAETKIVSVFSHLAASEDSNERLFTQKQIACFERLAQEIDTKLDHRPFRHLLNTSGIINYPEAQYDMVRSGIGLYGFGNEATIDAQLRPVATLKTIISQLHHIAPGESVGYNMGYVCDAEKTIATLPLGHADGIGRQYGKGKAYVSINGKRAQIIGNVCMDMIMVDVTDIDCAAGDEVIVFGKNSTAEEFARGAGTISYELLTGISQRVKRVVVV